MPWKKMCMEAHKSPGYTAPGPPYQPHVSQNGVGKKKSSKEKSQQEPEEPRYSLFTAYMYITRTCTCTRALLGMHVLCAGKRCPLLLCFV